MPPDRGSFKLHTEKSAGKVRDFIFVAAVGLLFVVLTVFLTFNLLDQSERHLDDIKEIHVEAPKGSRTKERETEADISVQRQVESNLDATKLYLEHHEITDRGMVQLSRLTRLTQLSLAHTRISDRGLRYLVNLPLTELNVSDTNITEEGLREINKITSLCYLNLCETSIGNNALPYLRDLKNLNDLHLAATSVTDSGLQELVDHHQPIWKLVLINTNITDVGLKKLAKLENLSNLYLDGTAITAGGLKAFEHHKALRKLSVPNCKINDDDVAKIVNIRPDLLMLNLSRTNVTDECFNQLSKLKSLKALTINNCSGVTNEGLAAFRAKMPAVNVTRDF